MSRNHRHLQALAHRNAEQRAAEEEALATKARKREKLRAKVLSSVATSLATTAEKAKETSSSDSSPWPSKSRNRLDVDTAKEETSSSSSGGGNSDTNEEYVSPNPGVALRRKPRPSWDGSIGPRRRRGAVESEHHDPVSMTAKKQPRAPALPLASDPAFVGAPKGSSISSSAVAAARAALSAPPSPYSPGGSKIHGGGGTRPEPGSDGNPPLSSSSLLESFPTPTRDRASTAGSAFSFGTSRSLLEDWKNEFAAWRRRNGIPEDGKVFIITGTYDDVRSALLARGWHENPDPDSRYFNLKWSLRAKDIDHPQLFDGQIVNHFAGAAKGLTTKVGLCRSLRYLHWHANADVDSFFPRCYDLTPEADETRAFHVDFKWTLAQSTLRRVLRDGGLNPRGVSKAEALVLALKVCQYQLKYEECLVNDSQDEAPELPPLDDRQWGILTSSPAFQPGAVPPSRNGGPIEPDTEPLKDDIVNEAQELLEKLAAHNPQASMEGCSNVWITKPAGKSRGRGIACVNRLEDLAAHTKAQAGNPLDERENRWIIQKYIEQPLVVHGRKFDIRQWVLLTSASPLTVWLYDEPYLRFCAEEYDLADVGNVFKHLSNNSIAKYSDEFKAKMLGDGNMWQVNDFKKFLVDRYGDDRAWENKIVPQIRDIVVHSMQCTEDTFEPRKKTCELYGYDFVIDDSLNVWLLEVNSSPSMEHSTPVTQYLCPRAFDDIFKVVLDAPAERARRKKENLSDKRIEEMDTGGWKLIHKAVHSNAKASSKMSTFGLDLKVTGQGVGPPPKPKRRKARPNPFGATSDRPGAERKDSVPAWERLSALRFAHHKLPPEPEPEPSVVPRRRTKVPRQRGAVRMLERRPGTATTGGEEAAAALAELWAARQAATVRRPQAADMALAPAQAPVIANDRGAARSTTASTAPQATARRSSSTLTTKQSEAGGTQVQSTTVRHSSPGLVATDCGSRGPQTTRERTQECVVDSRISGDGGKVGRPFGDGGGGPSPDVAAVNPSSSKPRGDWFLPAALGGPPNPPTMFQGSVHPSVIIGAGGRSGMSGITSPRSESRACSANHGGTTRWAARAGDFTAQEGRRAFGVGCRLNTVSMDGGVLGANQDKFEAAKKYGWKAVYQPRNSTLTSRSHLSRRPPSFLVDSGSGGSAVVVM